MPTLLCHIVWMPSYAGEVDVYAGGHDYVRDEGYGHELFNFMPFDGIYYGYVQSRSGTIDVGRLGADKDDTFVDDVTVIWTATPPQGKRVIVGWYRDARIFRLKQVGSLKRRDVKGEKVGFYARARAEDSVLVAIKQRDFGVPHHKKGLPGQASVFYPEDSMAPEMEVWLESALKYISNWSGNSALASEQQQQATGLPGQPEKPNVTRAGYPDKWHCISYETARTLRHRGRVQVCITAVTGGCFARSGAKRGA